MLGGRGADAAEVRWAEGCVRRTRCGRTSVGCGWYRMRLLSAAIASEGTFEVPDRSAPAEEGDIDSSDHVVAELEIAHAVTVIG